MFAQILQPFALKRKPLATTESALFPTAQKFVSLNQHKYLSKGCGE